MDIRERLNALTRAHEEAAGAIEAVDDPDAAYAQVKQLLDLVEQLRESTLELRLQLVGRIWDDNELSLSSLAKRVGLSKARADQLLRARRGDESDDG